MYCFAGKKTVLVCSRNVFRLTEIHCTVRKGYPLQLANPVTPLFTLFTSRKSSPPKPHMASVRRASPQNASAILRLLVVSGVPLFSGFGSVALSTGSGSLTRRRQYWSCVCPALPWNKQCSPQAVLISFQSQYNPVSDRENISSINVTYCQLLAEPKLITKGR